MWIRKREAKGADLDDKMNIALEIKNVRAND